MTPFRKRWNNKKLRKAALIGLKEAQMAYARDCAYKFIGAPTQSSAYCYVFSRCNEDASKVARTALAAVHPTREDMTSKDIMFHFDRAIDVLDSYLTDDEKERLELKLQELERYE